MLKMCRTFWKLNVGMMFYSDLFPVFVSFFANWLGVFYLLKLKIINSISLTLQLLQFNIASITLSSEQSWIILLLFSDESLFCDDHEKNTKVKKPSNPCDSSKPILSLLCQWETFHVFKTVAFRSVCYNENFFFCSFIAQILILIYLKSGGMMMYRQDVNVHHSLKVITLLYMVLLQYLELKYFSLTTGC